MKILIITQKADKNDPILGFFHRWIVEFSKSCESVIVICLEKGVTELPTNVKVLSLGKEVRSSKFSYIKKLYSYAWNERANYDVVFVHMNPIYVVLLGPLLKILKKKITLWYTHKHVDLKLRAAEKITDKIFTASQESFRLKSKKIEVVGHGIDTAAFAPVLIRAAHETVVISVARISPTKRQFEMIQAIESLNQKKSKVHLNIIGGPITSADRAYEKMLKEYIVAQSLSSSISFIGPVAPVNMPALYQQADIFLNLSSTGSLDKAVLEAMSCELQVLTSNEAFASFLTAEHVSDGGILDVASKIETLSQRPLDVVAREYVVRHHNVSLLIPKLLGIIASI